MSASTAQRSSTGVLATGSYVPEAEMTNAELAERFDVTEEWIVRKTRMLTRRYAAPHEATSDMAINAARAALAQAGIEPEQLDYLIVATTTPDSQVPPVATLTQSALGARNAACFDINIGCSAFVHALTVAQALMAARPGAHALVIGADTWSRFTDPMDRSTAVLLGDAAGAVVLGPVPAPYGILGHDLLGHGDDAPLLVIKGGGTRHPATHETVDEGAHTLRMNGRGVIEFVMTHVPPSIKEVLGSCGVAQEDVRHLVPHQANGALLGQLAEAAGLGGATLHTTLERYGNSGAASIPVTLDHAHRAGELGDGDLVVLSGFGGGMAVGTALLRWYAGGGR
ncbi:MULTISPECIES: 3-oxoacyl-ACP synthase III family protein [unclassified Streptomyces]|uniref:3-oxoacyl-ACP synthase III family protein n=1 Tax=unclassified Streptomyces TaxID=2593676 RepID=UPI0033DCE1E3